MENDRYFAAPWGRELRILTNMTVALLIGVPIVTGVALHLAGNAPALAWLSTAIPLIILFGTIPFGIRGYTLSGKRLIIHRFGWTHSVDLSNLKSATVDPHAFAGAVKTAGNGGLFSISGRFWSKALGHFRACASDPRLSVVLRFPNWTLLITPEYPDEFADDLQHRIPGCQIERKE
jgi:hypothetical protein